MRYEIDVDVVISDKGVESSHVRAFCPTGEGGGIDNSCGRNGGGSSLGMPDGVHTPAGAARLVGLLQEATGREYIVHGSVGRGKNSLNDIDLAEVPLTEDELTRLSNETNEAEAAVWDRVSSGEISRDGAMESLYGGSTETRSPEERTLAELGFRPTERLNWNGIEVIRYRNDAARHKVEIWRPSDSIEFERVAIS